MSDTISRRGFLGLAPVLSLGLPLTPLPQAAAVQNSAFPAQDAGTVKEIVTVAHGNLERVKELVGARPALARASWDWGYGDWETPIDAASHVGNRPIAEYLVANGARPTLFTAAMMGELAIVRRWVESTPGVQRHRGPHGLTLVDHARAGGSAAAAVLAYLEGLGDADPRYPNEPLTDAQLAAISGEYAFGTGGDDRLTVAKNARGMLTLIRTGAVQRNLFHHGGLVFNPSGAEAVVVRFEVSGATARTLVVEDGPVVVRAMRQ